MLYGFEHFLPALIIPLGCAGLAVAFWWRNKAWGWLALALIGWLAVLAVGFLSEFVVGSVFRPRIFIWTIFPFYILVAVGVLQIRKKYLLIPLLGIILASNVYGVVMEYNTTNTPWNVITKELVDRIQPDDGLIICPGWTEFGLQPYYSKAKAPAIRHVQMARRTRRTDTSAGFGLHRSPSPMGGRCPSARMRQGQPGNAFTRLG